MPAGRQLTVGFSPQCAMYFKAIRILPLLTAGVITAVITAAIAQGAADFIVIPDPLDYTIYNQYQQPVSEQEKAGFVPYSPFQIIDHDMMLGDQITRALKFDFQQKMFYLLKDENGKFTGEKSKTGHRVFHGAEPFEDTIEVQGKGLAMVSGAGRNVAMATGTRLVRVFRSGPRYYCAALLDRTIYGWSSLEPRSAWRKIEHGDSEKIAALRDTGLSEPLRKRILARFASANASYKVFFLHFNSLTGDERAVPQWRCESREGDRLLCRLAGSNGEQLSESSQFLAQDIGNMLIGTNFKVTSGNGEIDIQKRTGSD
jgi:hypothetical protein